MAHWFTKLMQKGHPHARRALGEAGFSRDADPGNTADARDARHDAIVRMLRERAEEDRDAREKRQLRYRQHLENGPGPASSASSAGTPVRLHRVRTKVPCRVSPEARVLLERLADRLAGGTVTFLPVTSRRQAVMLTTATGTEPTQIGWVEDCVEADPRLCNVRHQGLAVETDGGTMLVLRFRYPPTPVRMTSGHETQAATFPLGPRLPVVSGGAPLSLDARVRSAGGVFAPQARDGLELPCETLDQVARIDFTELRPALDLQRSDRGTSPRLVWVTRPEVESMDALGSRDFEAFYMRFKLEVQGGLWSALSGLLASSPGSQWHGGSYYTVVREPDGTNGRIYQKTVDDGGKTVDIGLDRVYDASAATDILLLYLGGDVLADLAEIYFALLGLSSTDAYFLKEEFFTVIRRFWAGSQSLAARYGSELAAVVRMSQRAVPTPAQAPLLKQEWTNLRQSLVDRYGAGGRNAAELAGRGLDVPRNGAPAWPFAPFPAGEINIGLRLVYRQEWRDLGSHRGEVMRTVPRVPKPVDELPTSMRGGWQPRRIETTVVPGETTRNVEGVVEEAARATVRAMKWPLNADGSISTGVRGLAARTHLGPESEAREGSRDTGMRLGEIMRRMASERPAETRVVASAEGTEIVPASASTDAPDAAGQDGTTWVYSRLQHRYEVLTRPAEIQNVVLVAEKLPGPHEIDLAWVKRYDWILAKVLLDESYRDALTSISREARSPAAGASTAEPGEVIQHVDTFSRTASVREDGIDMAVEWKREYRDAADGQRSRFQRDVELEAQRERLYEHVRANILHYQRAIWQEEDPQQRSMRYRKSGRKVPLEWRFELESPGALTIEELGARLAAATVDGQFAAYAEGREVGLDQLIDPAGPIGYYGNYAVYRMRPEFGSEDLFSLLHFFKSPYLRPNLETEEPEVADPVEIQLSEDPAVLAASDELIEQHRDEILAYVPELRREPASARGSARAGMSAGAIDRMEPRTGALRRHFATYLFRRERARRIALDTGGMVVDVIRSDPTPAPTDPLTGPEAYPPILECERGVELMSGNGARGPEAEWAILAQATPSLRLGAGGGASRARDPEGGGPTLAPGHVERTHRLLAGAGAARAQDPEAGRVIVGEDDAGPAPGLLAGPGTAPVPVIIAGDEAGWAPEPAGDGPARTSGEALAAGGAGERTPRLFAGAPADDPEPRPVILAEGDGERTLQVHVAAGAGDDRAPEPVILPGADGAPTPTLLAGAGPAPAPEPVILADGDGAGAPTLVAGGGAAQSDGRVILAGGDGENAPTLQAGAGSTPAHDPEAGRVVVPPDDEWLRPTLIAR